MAKTDKGKIWENIFKANWKKCFPGRWIFRLKDDMSGYLNASQNPCDFLCFPKSGMLFMVECKEHKGASIPFTAMPQYERLLEYKDYEDVYPGFVVWLAEKDIVFWLPIKEAEKMVNDGLKSVGIKAIEEGKYNIFVIPSEKKRIYLDSDYNALIDWIKSEVNNE